MLFMTRLGCLADEFELSVPQLFPNVAKLRTSTRKQAHFRIWQVQACGWVTTLLDTTYTGKFLVSWSSLCVPTGRERQGVGVSCSSPVQFCPCQCQCQGCLPAASLLTHYVINPHLCNVMLLLPSSIVRSSGSLACYIRLSTVFQAINVASTKFPRIT